MKTSIPYWAEEDTEEWLPNFAHLVRALPSLTVSSFKLFASTNFQIIQAFLVVFMGVMVCQKFLYPNWKLNCFLP